MFRNSLHNLARDQTILSHSRLQRTINFSACVYYSDLWLLYNPDSDKCTQFLCVVCSCLDHVYSCIHRLLPRLRKVTCRLLRQKPARRTDLEPLPDVLKDVANIKMVSVRPDVIPLFPASNNIRQENAGGSVIMATAYSSHQLNTDGHKNRYSLSHLCHCKSSIHGLQDTENNTTGIHHSNGRHITENNDVTYAKVTAQDGIRHRSSLIPSQVHTDFPHQSHHRNQFNSPGRFYSQKSYENNEPSHGLMLPKPQTHQIQLSSEANSTDGIQVEDRAKTTQTIHRGQEPLKSDSEITRDIILALRRVGDNIDSRIRFENKKSLLAMMGATKISDGWFVFMTLRQRSAVGAVVCLSLELLQQFDRL